MNPRKVRWWVERPKALRCDVLAPEIDQDWGTDIDIVHGFVDPSIIEGLIAHEEALCQLMEESMALEEDYQELVDPSWVDPLGMDEFWDDELDRDMRWVPDYPYDYLEDPS